MAINLIKVVLAFALVGGLFLAGWNIYHRLPVESAGSTRADREASGIEMTVVLGDGLPAPASTKVEAYGVDFAAVQREYYNGPRPQRQFDEFLGRRLKGLDPARGQFDEKGRLVLKVTLGSWWIRAIVELANGERLEWRMPINVAGPGTTVELTPSNLYERTKKF